MNMALVILYTLNILGFLLREKCPYSELFWSVFSRIWTEYGKSGYRDFLRSVFQTVLNDV